ncbi:winged helix-turn-helix transcriptional regulator [Saccharibacillus deserti]
MEAPGLVSAADARDGLIDHTVYPEVPPKVEYSLTPQGKSLTSILLHLQD